ncbi:MAG: triphosphoribosyl-dephospho-CoA synthase [Clostridiales bacterium]|nr:triphosphoribosyl-dephospho-CoA synthase [Clostridiales bacterium]
MTQLIDFVKNAALYALTFEANVTPKPGLVDRNNTGAHQDMTLSMLLKSAETIAPYIGACAQSGLDTKKSPFEIAFHSLQSIGLEAEKAMFKANGGVNTHKGAIYCFCLLAGAFGRLMGEGEISAEAILKTASELSKKASFGSLETARLFPSTHGDFAYKNACLSGARGEAISGYPGILHVALPALEDALHKGFSENDAGVYALLHLISKTNDTCIYSRGGIHGLKLSKSLAGEAIKGDFLKNAERMDIIFINKRLSPGGCADLLAAAMFIKILIQSKREGIICE